MSEFSKTVHAQKTPIRIANEGQRTGAVRISTALYITVFPNLLVEMICGGIILGFKESEFMLSCSCIYFRRKVIIIPMLLFPLIITDMPFRIADVCSSFSWRFVNLFIEISIFPHILSYI